MIFQSTPPARGATTAEVQTRVGSIISIHAPREGGDEAILDYMVGEAQFQSTPPARGATIIPDNFKLVVLISIHAPREGGDETA